MKKYLAMGLQIFSVAIIMYAVCSLINIVNGSSFLAVAGLPKELLFLSAVPVAIIIVALCNLSLNLFLAGRNLLKISSTRSYILYGIGTTLLLYCLYLLINGMQGQVPVLALPEIVGESIIPMSFQNAVAFGILMLALIYASYGIIKIALEWEKK